MTVLAAAHEGRRGPASAAARHWLEIGGILAALGIIVAGRWFAVTRGVPGLLVGFAFAAALLVVWAASDRSMGQRPSRPVPSRPGERPATLRPQRSVTTAAMPRSPSSKGANRFYLAMRSVEF